MRCGTAERLLHLYREGEVPTRRRERLERHLAACPVCRERARLLREELARLEAARREVCPPPVPDDLTETILGRTAAAGAFGRAGPARNPAAGPSRRPFAGSVPLLRPLPALLGLLLLGALALQEYLILDRLAGLEARLEATARQALLPAGTPALRPEMERGFQQIEEAARLLERPESLGRSGEWVAVRRSDLEALSQVLGRLPGGGDRLPRAVVERYPDLGTVQWGDGLDRTELDRLLAHRTELLRLLRSL